MKILKREIQEKCDSNSHEHIVVPRGHISTSEMGMSMHLWADGDGIGFRGRQVEKEVQIIDVLRTLG